jgi:hypothetical protein
MSERSKGGRGIPRTGRGFGAAEPEAGRRVPRTNAAERGATPEAAPK